MKALSILAFLALSSLSLTVNAAGFACLSVDENTRIDVYYEGLNSGSEPYASVMVVADPTVSKRRQHIATFNFSDKLLESKGGAIVGTVDHSFPGTSKRGERVGGTLLGSLAKISLEIDFSYTEPMNDGDHFAAQVTYTKRSGEHLDQEFDCVLFTSEQPSAELFQAY